MKNTILVAVTLAICVCAAPVLSQGPGRPGGQSGMGRFGMSCPVMAVMPPQSASIDRLSESLQLTEDQTSKLKSVLTKNEETVNALSKKSAEAAKALRTAVMADDFSAENVKLLADKAEKAEAAVVSAIIDEWVQIRAILTTDQVKTMQETMSKHQGSGQRPSGPPPGADDLTPPPAPER
ncbi:MAG: periplasmic heavy metal sensor [Armatimonadota bacterium]